ncbi:MAG: YHS domain-containing protein, partial [Geobacter sp.]
MSKMSDIFSNRRYPRAPASVPILSDHIMTLSSGEIMKDPVCGMDVHADSSPYRFDHDGVSYFFCCEHCRIKFRENPDKFLNLAAQSKTGQEEAREGYYFCPMCPEVHSTKPAPCPKCGMALEFAGETAPLQQTEWTCSMHPEVVQDTPGDCPKCGMALEARLVVVAEEENQELLDMKRRFWIALALSIPVIVSAMGMHIPGRPL